MELIKEKLPLPGVIGRVCPHPCETACRRNLVDKPVAICSSKRFAADQDEASEHKFRPEVCAEQRVQSGGRGRRPRRPLRRLLSCHEGSRRHPCSSLCRRPGECSATASPTIRLPQPVLDTEIGNILDLGVTLKTGVALGRDFTVQGLLC